MSEQAMWDRVRGHLVRSPRDHAARVENPAYPGTPDVHWCMEGVEGWLELKQKAEWPKRAATPLRVEHFTEQQKVWLKKRSMAGGRVHLLIQVKNDWLLFEGAVAARVLGLCPRAILLEKSFASWENGLDGTALREALKNGHY